LNNFRLILLIWIIPVACSNGDFSFKEEVPYKPGPGILEQIQEGDILLRQGTGPFSTHIVRAMEEEHTFSHSGIVCNIKGKLTVVHSISPDLSGIDGMQTQSLPDFFSDVADSNVAIIRPKMDSLQRIAFTGTALRFLAQKIPFDHHFNFEDTTQIYCSELVYHCYTRAMHKNPFKFKDSGAAEIMKFDSFFQPEYFTTVWQAKKTK